MGESRLQKGQRVYLDWVMVFRPCSGSSHQTTAKAMTDQVKLEIWILGTDGTEYLIHSCAAHQPCPLFHLVIGCEVEQMVHAPLDPAKELTYSSRASTTGRCGTSAHRRAACRRFGQHSWCRLA